MIGTVLEESQEKIQSLDKKLEKLKELVQFKQFANHHKMSLEEAFEHIQGLVDNFRSEPESDTAMKNEMIRVGIDTGSYENDRMSCFIQYLSPKV